MTDSKSIKNAKLTRAEIPGLRHRLRNHITTVAQEADRYGVGIETIRRAKRGETFRDVREGLEEEETNGLPVPPNPTNDAEAQASLDRLRHLLEEEKPAEGGALDDYLRTHPTKRKDNE